MQRLLLWWWPEFRRSAAEMSLCILRERNAAAQSFDDAGIPVRFLGHGRFDPRTPQHLADLVRRERIDVLHCHGYGSTNFGRIAGRLTKRPVIVHEHMIDGAMPGYQRIADRMLSASTDRAIAVSAAVADFLEKDRAVRRDRITVVPNGIPDDSFLPHPETIPLLRAELDIPDGHTVVGTVGRLHPVKGHDTFLRAAAEVVASRPNTSFVIVGDGSELFPLEDLATELGIRDRVRFAGYRTDVAALIAMFDVLVVASLSEGFALTAAEAMAQAKPVVATRVGGIPEVVADGVTGRLVPPSDPSSMGKAILEVLANPQRAAAMGEQGLRLCRERFSIAANVRRFCEIYEEILAAR